MKNKFRIISIVVFMLFLSTMISNAQYGRSNNRMSYSGQCLNIPGLTDNQTDKIITINDAHQKTIDNLRSDFYVEEDLILANNIKSKMSIEQNNHLKKISKVLNEEQLKYFNENIVTRPLGRRANRRVRQVDTGGWGISPSGMGYGRSNRNFRRGMGRNRY